jgi:hypothetical protein
MKRVYHSWLRWECYKAGFYNEGFEDKTNDEMKILYSEFFKDLNAFEKALSLVIKKWKYSCEHFLTNPSINKIAWLGQASACIWMGYPSKYKSGFYLLSNKNQELANRLAWKYFKLWKKKYINTSKNGKDRVIQLEFQMRYQ